MATDLVSRIHLQENIIWSMREIFNRTHSSLRGVIERTFGVKKKKWRILTSMPSYDIRTQMEIVIASVTLHNFIRLNAVHDMDFDIASTLTDVNVDGEEEDHTEADQTLQ